MKYDFPLEDKSTMTSRSEAITKIGSLLTVFNKEKIGNDQTAVALILFQYLAQPEIIHLFDQDSHFRQTILDKIKELRQNSRIQRNPLFASAFTTIEERWFHPIIRESR
jgi:hypothetical protein